MKNLMLGMLALTASASVAMAQDTVQVGQIGIIAKEPTTVTLNADKLGIAGTFKAGAECKLIPGDTLQVVGVLADGSVLVQRKLHLRVAKPDTGICPRGSIARIGAPAAVAAVKAKQAVDAQQTAKRGKKS